jgi:NTP pyrophosphatase (non-canonical NTP hydrolase)
VTDNDFDLYQEMSASYRSEKTTGPRGMLMALGLAEEAGEVAGKVKKLWRDSDWSVIDQSAYRELIKSELGDCCWYIAQLAREFDIKLSDVVTANISKLESRRRRGVLGGSGDNR